MDMWLRPTISISFLVVSIVSGWPGERRRRCLGIHGLGEVWAKAWLSGLKGNHCLYVALENEIRDNWNWDRWVCKKRLCLCRLLVLVLDGPRAALVPLDVLLFLWARSVQWDNKSLLRSVSQFVFSFCYVCRDSRENHKVVIRSEELLTLDPRIQNYLILGKV